MSLLTVTSIEQKYFFISFSLSRRIQNCVVVVACRKTLNTELFMQLYNDLCDAIESVNSIFANQLIFVLTTFICTNVFQIYGALRETNGFVILIGGAWVIIFYSMQFFMAHAGSSTTNEAERSIVMVAKIAGAKKISEDLKWSLNSSLIQMRCRNTKLENIFFTINWRLVLAVSFDSKKRWNVHNFNACRWQHHWQLIS